MSTAHCDNDELERENPPLCYVRVVGDGVDAAIHIDTLEDVKIAKSHIDIAFKRQIAIRQRIK